MLKQWIPLCCAQWCFYIAEEDEQLCKTFSLVSSYISIRAVLPVLLPFHHVNLTSALWPWPDLCYTKFWAASHPFLIGKTAKIPLRTRTRRSFCSIFLSFSLCCLPAFCYWCIILIFWAVGTCHQCAQNGA